MPGAVFYIDITYSNEGLDNEATSKVTFLTFIQISAKDITQLACDRL